MRPRVYFDWNATTPLRPEARAAMLEAMEAVGNPSSIHAEGRAARGIVERARAALGALVDADPEEIVFTAGATEAAMLALKGAGCGGSAVEHDCVAAWIDPTVLSVDRDGVIAPVTAAMGGAVTKQAANSETGVIQRHADAVLFEDAAQAAGKIPYSFAQARAASAAVSAHKFGGPKGVGALLLRAGQEPASRVLGGGQERGRRSGTENVIGIAGLGAAATAAARDVADGVWEPVAALRDRLEARLAEAAPDLIRFGAGAERLSNTTAFAAPEWSGETQVIQMDLAGFAVSAGSACSSGKVKASRVAAALGYDAETAASALRVSLGPDATAAAVDAFADAWIAAYRRWRARRG